MKVHKFLYECDPDKNTECPKRNCIINGGECHGTRQRKFAKTPYTLEGMATNGDKVVNIRLEDVNLDLIEPSMLPEAPDGNTEK